MMSWSRFVSGGLPGRPIKLLLMLLPLMLLSSLVSAQLVTPFQARYSVNLVGNITLIGNQLQTCPISASSCVAARLATAPPIRNNNNNNFVMQQIDIDVDPTTFNSSRARLTLPYKRAKTWMSEYRLLHLN